MGSLPAPVQRWLTILLPPLALLVCCLVILPRQNTLRKTNQDIRATKAQIKDYTGKLAAIRNLPKDPEIATLPMTKQEQSDFLRGLTTLCTRSGNRIVSILSLSAPPASPDAAKDGDAKKKDAQPSDLPSDVMGISSTVTFEGTFKSLRSFLALLQGAQRLVSMDSCRIVQGRGGYPILQTTLTVVRYVDAPADGSGSQPVATANASQSGPSS